MKKSKSQKFVNEDILLDKEKLFALMLKAHELDITLNQLVNKILKEHLDELETK